MALKDGSGYYTKFTYVENGRHLVRRIRGLEIQAADGRLYVVEGRGLPDVISSKSSEGTKGSNVLQLLVPKRALKAGLPGGPKPVTWLSRRDLVAMITGSALVMVLLGIIRLAALAF